MSLPYWALLISAAIGVTLGLCARFGYSTAPNGQHETWATSARIGATITGILTAVVLVIWFLVAVPVSTYNRNNCQRIADGYGMDDYDWSFRSGCRIQIPTGQLVPEDRIRITSDGQIVSEGQS